jgi:hypothetical protein
LEPFDRDAQNEQIGTTSELVAGVAALLLGCLAIWAIKSGSVTLGWR